MNQLRKATISRAKAAIINFKDIKKANGIHYCDIYYPEKSKYYRFCCEFDTKDGIFDSGTSCLRCAYNAEKCDFNFSHKCTFEVKTKQDFIPPYEMEELPHIDKNDDIIKKAAQFTVANDISKNSIDSESFKDLINHTFNAGFNYARKNKDVKIPPVIKVPIDKVHENIVKISDMCENKTKEKLKSLDFFAISFDSGTVVNRNALYYYGSNPSRLNNHLYIGSKRNYSGSCSYDYKYWAESLMKEYGNISAFVADGLPAGISGIADYKFDSLLSESMGTITLFSPCHDHIINKAFEKACSKNETAKNIIDMIDNIAILLNKGGVKEILVRVPHIPHTRWLYAYDIANYVLKHKTDINDVLKRTASSKITELLASKQFSVFKNGVPNSFSNFVDASKPVKYFQLACECESASMSHVYLFLIYTINELENIEANGKNDETKVLASVFKESIIHEFMKKSRLPLLVFSFAMTPLGMKYIQGANIQDLLTVDLKLIINQREKEINVEDIDNDDGEIEENDNESTERASQREPYKYVNKFRLAAEKDKRNKNVKMPRFDDLNKNADIPENLILSPDQVINIATDVFSNREQMKRIYKQNAFGNAKLQKKIEEDVLAIEQIFFMFLTEPTNFENINLFKSCSRDLYGYCFWKKNIISSSDLKHVAYHALQMMSIPASEADCERAISMTRHLYDEHKGKENEQFTEKRIRAKIYMSSCKKDVRKNSLFMIDE